MNKYAPTATQIITYVFASLLPSMALGLMLAIAHVKFEQVGNFEGKSGFAVLYYAPPWIIASFFLICGLIPVLTKTEFRFSTAIKCLLGASALIALFGVLSF
jgi:hypothetical protein